MKRGYTLMEVLMALGILSILAVPLGYVLTTMGEGSARARLQDQALSLSQEAWTLSRAESPDSLRDTSWERNLSGADWRIVRDIFDSSDRARSGLSTLKPSDPGSPPVEISVCALRRQESTWDTIRCFRWLRPRARILP